MQGMELLGPVGHVVVPPGRSQCEILLCTAGPRRAEPCASAWHGAGCFVAQGRHRHEEKAQEEAWGCPTSAPLSSLLLGLAWVPPQHDLRASAGRPKIERLLGQCWSWWSGCSPSKSLRSLRTPPCSQRGQMGLGGTSPVPASCWPQRVGSGRGPSGTFQLKLVRLRYFKYIGLTKMVGSFAGAD